MYKRIKLETVSELFAKKFPISDLFLSVSGLEPVQGMKANQTTEYLTLLNICF